MVCSEHTLDIGLGDFMTLLSKYASVIHHTNYMIREYGNTVGVVSKQKAYFQPV